MKIQVKQSVDKALQALNKQQREVVVLRFGLDDEKKWVLQEIADKYSLTRERIRQIQNTALKQLGKDPCVKALSEAVDHVEDALRSCGGVLSEERLCMTCEASTKKEKNYINLLLTIADRFYLSPENDEADRYWYLDDESKKKADVILQHLHGELAKEKDRVFKKEEIQGLLEHAPHDVEAEYDVFADLSKKIGTNYLGEWGLKNHPEIKLNTLAGYITVILRIAQKPLHFTEISEKISEVRGAPCHQESCHNELVRREDFVLVGRGMYALRDLGYRSGTVADIVAEILKENGPMTRPLIIASLKKERIVKDQSIISALNNSGRFGKNENKEYFLIEIDK